MSISEFLKAIFDAENYRIHLDELKGQLMSFFRTRHTAHVF